MKSVLSTNVFNNSNRFITTGCTFSFTESVVNTFYKVSIAYKQSSLIGEDIDSPMYCR